MSLAMGREGKRKRVGGNPLLREMLERPPTLKSVHRSQLYTGVQFAYTLSETFLVAGVGDGDVKCRTEECSENCIVVHIHKPSAASF